MPIYMDIHQVPGAEALDLAEAHRKDMLIQNEFHCKCMTYWLDEPRGVAFCLIEAPDKTAVEVMHKNSHGFIPNKIIEVNNELVSSFLGRIQDPEDVVVSDTGLKVFSEAAFRILLITEIVDPVILRHTQGSANANELLEKIKGSVRKNLAFNGGREIEHAGYGFIISFTSAVRAITCAMEIQKDLAGSDRTVTGFKMSIHAGEPVAKSERLFGDVIQFASCLCTITNNDQIIISSVVRELVARDFFQKDHSSLRSVSPQDEIFVESLFRELEENWQNPDVSITDFCQFMSMSKSQLYRKTIALWGMAPNDLLKNFRLNKARELLKRNGLNISQTTFDSGFSSPSYFTKCFKKRFGLLPAAYLNSLH